MATGQRVSGGGEYVWQWNRRRQKMDENIDIIIPWVDGSDPEWRAEKEKAEAAAHAKGSAVSDIRYESWENFHYWFRAIEKFMPWYHRIVLVTCGHLPDFLNTGHPRLKIVRHADYIPAKYLPTFNSHTIEMNFHRIEDLSENLVMFNDDFFPLQPIDREYFFKNGMVCDEAVESAIVPVDADSGALMVKHVLLNNMCIINRHFDKRKVQARHREKWYCADYGELLGRTESLAYWDHFTGFRDPHLPGALKKTTLRKLWDLEYEMLDAASRNTFRSFGDVMWWLARYWQLCEGDFIPRRARGKFYIVTKGNCEEVAEVIRNRSQEMVALNEECTAEEFIYIKQQINGAFEAILPEKCSFER